MRLKQQPARALFFCPFALATLLFFTLFIFRCVCVYTAATYTQGMCVSFRIYTQYTRACGAYLFIFYSSNPKIASFFFFYLVVLCVQQPYVRCGVCACLDILSYNANATVQKYSYWRKHHIWVEFVFFIFLKNLHIFKSINNVYDFYFYFGFFSLCMAVYREDIYSRNGRMHECNRFTVKIEYASVLWLNIRIFIQFYMDTYSKVKCY